MLEAKHNVKSFQIQPILSMHVKNDFDKVNSQQSEEYHNFSISMRNE